MMREFATEALKIVNGDTFPNLDISLLWYETKKSWLVRVNGGISDFTKRSEAYAWLAGILLKASTFPEPVHNCNAPYHWEDYGNDHQA